MSGRRLPFFRAAYRVRSKRHSFLLNRALREGVTLFGIERGEGEIAFSVRRSDVPPLERILSEEGLAYDRLGVRSVGAFGRKLVSRPFLFASIVLTLFAVLFFGRFVYGYSVTGNALVDRSAVESVLKENGVTGFTYRSRLDLPKIKREIAAIDGVAFVSVRLTGTRLAVEIKEELSRVEPDPVRTEPIRASRDAVVTNVVAESGTPRVAAGDSVKAGEVLIDPLYTFTEGESPSPARGVVTGRVVYRREYLLPACTTESLPTGRTTACRAVYFCGKPLGEEPISSYAVYRTEDRILSSACGVTVLERTFIEYADRPVWHDFDAEAAVVARRLTEEFLLEIPFYATERSALSLVQKKVDNMLVTVLYYTVEQRIDDSIPSP